MTLLVDRVWRSRVWVRYQLLPAGWRRWAAPGRPPHPNGGCVVEGLPRNIKYITLHIFYTPEYTLLQTRLHLVTDQTIPCYRPDYTSLQTRLHLIQTRLYFVTDQISPSYRPDYTPLQGLRTLPYLDDLLSVLGPKRGQCTLQQTSFPSCDPAEAHGQQVPHIQPGCGVPWDGIGPLADNASVVVACRRLALSSTCIQNARKLPYSLFLRLTACY